MKHLLLTTIAAVILLGCATMSPPDYSLSDAIKKGDIEVVKQHLAAGADVNAWIPSRKSSSGVVSGVVAAGVLTGIWITSTGGWAGTGGFGSGGGETTIPPLHLAAEYGRKEVAELLIANGAIVNSKIHVAGITPLHKSTANGHKEVAELLIANGAHVNAKTNNGRTPLHSAAYWGRKEVAALLIAKGADVNAKDKSGSTPLGGATRRKHSEITDLLRKHGGKTGEELKAEGK